ncbi:MFS transporter [Achromobacter xylosoxidans]|uniref:MFS transporter n=1 Tax=Alcaligenes xylosoxydans xylosoxydans TaxID=85698 RepID=UPI001EEAB0C8|nr:MFS transporter [Achromobacter xylosoxidans]
MRDTPVFFGWKVLYATFVLAVFGWGVGFYGPPVFLHAVVQRTGWSVALVSAAVSLHFLCGTLIVANLPRLYRRWGVPAVTLAGAVALALGVSGWARAAAPWQLYAAALFSGMGWVTLGAAAVNALIAPWFVKRRPAALGMAYNGASVGGIVFSPLWVFLISGYGFAQAAWWIGATMVIVIAILARKVFAVTPRRLGQHPDGVAPDPQSPAAAATLAPVPRLWRDRAFLSLGAGMALGLFAQIGLIAHLLSLLAPLLGAQTAGIAMGLATASAIAGRSLVGWLMPPSADRRKVACVSYGAQILGSLVLMLAADHAWAVWAGVLLFGAGIGNATSLPPLIAQSEFGREDALRVVPLIVAVSQGAYAFAPAVFGVLRAMAGQDGQSMFAFLAVAACLQAAAIACLAWGRGAAWRRGLSPARRDAPPGRP